MRERLLLGGAIIVAGSMTAIPTYAHHCQGGGHWCHSSGDCDAGASPENAPPREHEHESGGGVGCTGHARNNGACSGEYNDMEWQVACFNGPAPGDGFCYITMDCPDGRRQVPTGYAARCDNDTCIIRGGLGANKCYVHTCAPGATQISCSGLGI